MDRQKFLFTAGGVWELVRFSVLYVLVLSILWEQVDVTRSFLVLWFGSAQIVCAGIFFSCRVFPRFREGGVIILILAKGLSVLSGILFFSFQLGLVRKGAEWISAFSSVSISSFLFTLQEPTMILPGILIVIDLLFFIFLIGAGWKMREIPPGKEEPERLPDFAETEVEEE